MFKKETIERVIKPFLALVVFDKSASKKAIKYNCALETNEFNIKPLFLCFFIDFCTHF